MRRSELLLAPAVMTVVACGAPAGSSPGGPVTPAVIPSAAPSPHAARPADPPWVARMMADVNLPYATDVLDMIDAPVIASRGGILYVDGARVDRLPDAPKDGGRTALLQLPMDLPLRDLRELLRQVAKAGFTESSVMVRNIREPGDQARIARMPVDALVTPPADAEERVLHIEITQPEKYTLIWKQGNTVVSTVDVPRNEEHEFERGGATVVDMPALARKVQDEWRVVGAHRDLGDAAFDRAVLHVDESAKLAQVVGAIDAVRRSHRSTTAGSAGDVSAFRVAVSEPAPPTELTLGFGRVGHSTRTPSLRQGPMTVNGRFPSDVIARIVRQNYGRFRLCYENGLRTNPDLAGTVAIKFTINRNGEVSSAASDKSALPDPAVVSCVARGFSNLSFPQPDRGDVKVHYEIVFDPG